MEGRLEPLGRGCEGVGRTKQEQELGGNRDKEGAGPRGGRGQKGGRNLGEEGKGGAELRGRGPEGRG